MACLTPPGVFAGKHQQALKAPKMWLCLDAVLVRDARVVVAREHRHRLYLQRIGATAVQPRVSDLGRDYRQLAAYAWRLQLFKIVVELAGLRAVGAALPDRSLGPVLLGGGGAHQGEEGVTAAHARQPANAILWKVGVCGGGSRTDVILWGLGRTAMWMRYCGQLRTCRRALLAVVC